MQVTKKQKVKSFSLFLNNSQTIQINLM